MSVKISISCVVKGYHLCPFKVKEDEVFFGLQKEGRMPERVKVFNERGQLGHLQTELVSQQIFLRKLNCL